jgi:hypothetical protein
MKTPALPDPIPPAPSALADPGLRVVTAPAVATLKRDLMTKLTDTQLIILSSASQREDGLATLPETLKGGAAQKVVAKLIASGFLKEVRVKGEQPAWRTNETGHPVGLKVTKAGAAAIGVEHDTNDETDRPATPNSDEAESRAPVKGRADQAAPRAGSKQALVISLLQREGGATLDELVDATGWLQHTTRAALTGLRKKGNTIEKSKREDDKTAYSIDPGETKQQTSKPRRSSKKAA